jgi:ribosome-associated toxin RatA of RatAB toxin-antitoxin module
METSIGIEIAASPRRVYDLAAQLPRWPELLPHYRYVTVESQRGSRIVASMGARRPGRLPIPVRWRAEHWSDESDAADLRLYFAHVGGATKGMRVVWHIRPCAVGALVRIDHSFERRLPLLAADLFPRLVDALFVRPIAGRTLATFKALAERNAA